MGNFGENYRVLSIRRPADIIAVSLPFLWLLVFHGQAFLNPGELMYYNGGGDGIKNYYTLAWFVEHNEGLVEFEGMNYPYGDMVVFTDNHPALSWVLKGLGVDGSQTVGILNFLLLLSLVIASVFLYDILKIFGVKPYLAGVGALLIAVSMPQWGRMEGHYSLAHLYMLPASIWLLIKYLKSPGTWRWTVLFALCATLWFFTHPYLGLMACGMAVLCQGLIWVRERGQHWKIRIGHSLVQAFIPVAFFQGIVWVMDSHANRPSDPSGFWEYMARVPAIFLPSHGPLAKTFEGIFIEQGIEWETWAYVGIAALLLIPFVMVWQFKLGGGFRAWSRLHPPQVVFLASVLLLCFSLGWIFLWFPALADWLSPIKNFRVLARFCWPFVLVFNLLVIGKGLALWSKGSIIYRTAVILILLLGFVEAADWHGKLIDTDAMSRNHFSNAEADLYEDVIRECQLADCGSIYSLPLFHVGSESFDTHTDDQLVITSMKLGIFTGLPLVSSMMSRTSITETIGHLQLNAPFNYTHNISEDIDQSRPTLLVASAQAMNDRERKLVSHSRIIGEKNGIIFAILDWEHVFNQPVTVALREGDISLGHAPLWIGEYRDLSDAYNVFQEFEPGTINPGIYECSFWYKRILQNKIDEAFVVQKTNQDGSVKWIEFDTINRSCLFSGDSIRYAAEFEIDDSTATYHLMLTNKNQPVTSIAAGHVLLRSVESNVIDTLSSGKVRINNHLVSSVSNLN